MQLAIVTMLFYGFFVAVAAGMTVIQDERVAAGRAAPRHAARAGEYIWAKFAAVLAGCADHPGHPPGGDAVLQPCAAQRRGPGDSAGRSTSLNYLKPALLFSVPTIVFLAGVSFAVGEWTRRPVAGLSAAGGDRARRRLLPLGVVAELARPAAQSTF